MSQVSSGSHLASDAIPRSDQARTDAELNALGDVSQRDSYDASSLTQSARQAVISQPTPPSPPEVQVKNDQPPAIGETDPNLWLEEVLGEEALAWVRARNAESTASAGSPPFDALVKDILAVMDSKEKIPFIAKHNDYFYNLWKDGDNPRGLWRRTTLAEYYKKEPAWEIVLDIDALGAREGTSYVFAGASYLEPECDFCILSLSPGGSDATIKREFNLRSKQFVDDGFVLPPAKSGVSWVDADTLFVATECGPSSMTTSGYPRTIRKWRRGTALGDAPVVYEGADTDVSVGAWHDSTKGFERNFLHRSPTFFTSETFLLDDSGAHRKIDIPDDAQPIVHREWLAVHLRTAWTVNGKTYAAGALLGTRFERFMAGDRDFTILFEPSATTSLESVVWTRDHLVLNVLDDVKNRLRVLTPGSAWAESEFVGAPTMGTVHVDDVDPETNEYFMIVEDFVTPSSLMYGQIGGAPEVLKQTPTYFNAADLQVSQHFVSSKDGTRVPYFQVARRDLPLDGSNRTLLSGYGGFEVSQIPFYSGIIGRSWLTDGGVYVLANIRGGGEYGPRWHEAALKANRHRAYEDFAAIAEDLIARGVTSAKGLGIQGGSNGGLLMGNMVTQYPQLFGAVVCEVPLLDMKRFSHLLAGASWMGEYGDPDKPEEWAFIKTFSPYHNLHDGVAYPPVLFTTSTRDDRVHPGHARKMMEKMRQMGCDVSYYENIEGGHGGAADNKQAAFMRALAFAFLRRKLAPRPSA